MPVPCALRQGRLAVQLRSKHGRFLQLLQGSTSLLLYLNVVINYTLCMLIPPGSTENIVEARLTPVPSAADF